MGNTIIFSLKMKFFIATLLLIAVINAENRMFTLNFQACVGYGDPKNGCCSDEVAGQLTGVSGYDVCLPRANGSTCPTNQRGGNGQTAPIVQDQKGNRYCAVMCNPSTTCQNGARCEYPHNVQLQTYGNNFHQAIGICMYPM